jgi:hypothetical protein
MSSAPSVNSARGGLFHGAAGYQARTPWRPGSGVVATIAIIGLSFLGASLLLAFLGLGGTPGRPEGVRLLAAGQALMVALTLLASSLLGGRPHEVLALRRAPAGWRTYAGALLLLAALQLVLAAVQHSVLGHDMLTDLRPYIGLVRGPDWPLTAAVVGLGAPLSEELLFRGFLLSTLARTRLGFWGAALASNLAWTALHAQYSAVGLAEVFALGLLFSWLLWRTGSLRVPIVCHALYNSLILLVLRLVVLQAAV